MSGNFINAILAVVLGNPENDCHTAESFKDIALVNVGVMYLKSVGITTMISFYGAVEMSTLKN